MEERWHMANEHTTSRVTEGRTEYRGSSNKIVGYKPSVPTGAVPPKPAPVPQKSR